MKLRPLTERIEEHRTYFHECVEVEHRVSKLWNDLTNYHDSITSISSDNNSIFIHFLLHDFVEVEAGLIPTLSDLGSFRYGKWTREVSEAAVKWHTLLALNKTQIFVSIQVKTSKYCTVTPIPTGRTTQKSFWKEVPVFDYEITCPEEDS